MPRCLLSAVLFAALGLAAPAMAMEPARHSADGGCPGTNEATDPEHTAAEPAAAPAKAPALSPPPSQQAPQRRTLSKGEATRVPLRWHSFVPGMFM